MLGGATSTVSLFTGFCSLAGEGFGAVEEGNCFQITSTIQSASSPEFRRIGKKPQES